MDQKRYYSQNYSNSNSTNRVYVNRNFNKTAIEPINLPNSNVHLNPNFSQNNPQQATSNQNHQAPRTRIHVNPNFIRAKPQELSVTVKPQIISASSMSGIVSDQLVSIPGTSKLQSCTQPPTITKSRYCFVRNKENNLRKTSPVKQLPKPTAQLTVKINKYKLISLKDVKKNLTSEKNSTKINEINSNQVNISKSKYKIRPQLINNVQNSRYKFVKCNTSLVNSPETKVILNRRISITLNKSIPKSSYRHKKKINKSPLKKNNIPCPLFKKYGKCLRMDRGTCVYLHDKKHVSICRSFLKGICHNKLCLLSHDLTDKKMPTCYFYLQGICTKDACPYLHVKINEKAKICQDFVKGYCEMGDECIYRHIASSKNTSKLPLTRKSNIYNFTNKNKFTENVHKKHEANKRVKTILIKEVTKYPCERESSKDQRYFKDVEQKASSEEQSNLIKPTRCKLGTLPSFIQL